MKAKGIPGVFPNDKLFICLNISVEWISRFLPNTKHSTNSSEFPDHILCRTFQGGTTGKNFENSNAPCFSQDFPRPSLQCHRAMLNHSEWRLIWNQNCLGWCHSESHPYLNQEVFLCLTASPQVFFSILARDTEMGLSLLVTGSLAWQPPLASWWSLRRVILIHVVQLKASPLCAPLATLWACDLL